MQVLIVDDEPLARLRLARLIDELTDCEVCGEAENGEDALEKVYSLDPDLVLLDVRMPRKDGIAVAKALEDIEDPPAVVFCTAYDDYALQAFDTMAQGYLVKPVQLEQLKNVIEKTTKLTKVQSRRLSRERNDELEESNKRRHISAKSRKGVELILIDDIYCFVADHKYVTVHHAAGETLIDETLKELGEELAAHFLRVHRNALVAIDKIDGLVRDTKGQNRIRLKNIDYRPVVSRRHLPHVREILSVL